MSYEIFTDGSSRGNPGPGGWATIIIDLEKDTVTEIGGYVSETTNNRMEVSAACEALQKIPDGSEGKIFTDSSYLINGATKWLWGWKKNDWISSTKKEILNQDLWTKLDESLLGKKIKWIYVGGHAGIPGNERCDVIATSLATDKEIDLYKGTLAGYQIKNIRDVSQAVSRVASKDASKKGSKNKAYSYVTLVDREIVIYKNWPDCEKAVKGKSGARFKKSIDQADEATIVREFGGK